MLIELNGKNIDEVLNSEKPLVIEFYSPACVHCKRTEAGLLENAKEQGDEVVIAKCDITAEEKLAQQYDVEVLPTLLFIKDGEVKERLTGFTHKLIIAENIRKIK
ncbi:MAG: thioredoxin family protein [Oscillospiraceae bacterium]